LSRLKGKATLDYLSFIKNFADNEFEGAKKFFEERTKERNTHQPSSSRRQGGKIKEGRYHEENLQGVVCVDRYFGDS